VSIPKGAKMGISIVILAYNKALMTQKCIDYIRRNVTDITYEIILIDNASNDIISDEYKKKVRYVRNEENLMFSRGCNQGASLAKYDNLCFLNNDVYIWNGFEDAFQFMLSDESHGIVGVKLLYENGAIQHAGVEIVGDKIDQNITNHRYRGYRGNHDKANIIREYQNVTGACMFMRKADFEAVGGFSVDYINNFEDNDLCFKVNHQLNKKIMYFPNVFMQHLEAQSPRDTTNFKFQQNHNLFFERWKDKLIIDKDKWDDEDNGWQGDSVSIVFPYLNQPRMTEECIDSIIKNTNGIKYEIIVVDNGSSEQISEEHKKKVNYVRSEKNLYYAGGTNLGISKAKYKYLCLLNNDIIIKDKDWVQKNLAYFTKYSNVGIVAPKLLYDDGKVQHAGVEFYNSSDKNNGFAHHRYRGMDGNYPPLNIPRKYQAVTGACMFITREDLRAVGGIDENYISNFEDIDLCLKIGKRLKKDIWYNPDSTVVHLESKTRNFLNSTYPISLERFWGIWTGAFTSDREEWNKIDQQLLEVSK
jgi:GT2 family glycosyltransferase